MNIDGLLPLGLWAVAIVVVLVFLRVANVVRYIPNNQVGIVEKLWSQKGSIENGFIALNGEAGYEPEVLRGGLHVFFPFMYRIHTSDLVTVGQGKIAYVFARDGEPLGASQVLGANDSEDKSDFQDARRFLLGGGQKGPQRKVLREGTYYGQCSELCGNGHGYMPIVVEAVSKEKFDAWVQQKKAELNGGAPATTVAAVGSSN